MTYSGQTPQEKHIETFIGVWGVKTHLFIHDTATLHFSAAQIFEIENTGNTGEMLARIIGLGRDARKRLAKKNIAVVSGQQPRPIKFKKPGKKVRKKRNRPKTHKPSRPVEYPWAELNRQC